MKEEVLPHLVASVAQQNVGSPTQKPKQVEIVAAGRCSGAAANGCEGARSKNPPFYTPSAALRHSLLPLVRVAVATEALC